MAQLISSQEFEEKVLKAEGPVLVDFFAVWCGPCKMLAPTLDQVSEEIGDAGAIYKIDVDQSSDIAAQYGVMSVPTLILFKNGEVVKQEIGAKPKGAILAMFE